MKKFKRKKAWISLEEYERILKMLLSPNEEDFEIGCVLLAKHNITPSRLLNENSKESMNSNFRFKMKAGKLTRRTVTLVERMRPYQIAYNISMMNLQNIQDDK